ncbi:single-stranded DNA-binding protein [Clostridium sp. MSJ-11]|uniref:Single-stranded DNA-binding protein n=1 Tax=Clostridium mobile TaxID=2841512 RepID=A0ABS6EG00_9CLOT|nr:DUF1413 domain-containing protein [Clostridium mobile]MBU5483339.1 single-stranded DNA-binding protein [Clostridium mobile]
MSNVKELLKIEKAKIDKLNPDEIFLVRDLLKGYDWNRILIRGRILHRRLFVNFIRNVDNGVAIIEKTSSVQQKYMISNAEKEDF